MAIKVVGPDGEEMLRVASRAISIAGSAPDAPKLPAELMLLPWGQVRSTNGDFLVDETSAQAVLEAFQQHGTDLVIDYEHQSLGGRYAAPSGLAPAAGWVTDLEVRAGQGIWGKVRWTLSAARRILRQEYRFLSPVVIVRKDDRRVISLDSVALTNRPAIAGMQPVVNRRGAGTADKMTRCQGETVTTQDGGNGKVGPHGSQDVGLLEQVNQVQTKEDGMQEQWKQLRELLAVDDSISEQEVLQQACGRLGELIDKGRRDEAGQRVACAMQAGKVSEAQKEWATQFALRDPTGFEEWAKGAPVLVPLQQIVAGSRESSPEGPAGQRRAVIAAARSEYQSNELLRQLTGERAYVNEVLQQAGVETLGAQENL